MRSHVLCILGWSCLLFLECQHEESGGGYLQWDTGRGGSEADLGCVDKEVWDRSAIPTVGMELKGQSRRGEYEFDKQMR